MKSKELAMIRLIRLKMLQSAQAEPLPTRKGYWRGFADGLKYAECVLSGEPPKDGDFVGVQV